MFFYGYGLHFYIEKFILLHVFLYCNLKKLGIMPDTMKRPNHNSDNWRWYVATIVPVLLTTGIVLLVVFLTKSAQPSPAVRECTTDSDCQNQGACTDKKCVCTSQWKGDRCQLYNSPPSISNTGNSQCGVTPKSCTSDDECFTCGTSTPFQCKDLTANENSAGLKGKYCLPEFPVDNCIALPPDKDYSKQIPGHYVWEGWQDVETEKWTCACEFPDYYPPATGTQDDGACKRSPELCQYGNWTYPCKPDLTNTCVDLSDEEKVEMLGSSPLQNGRCDCTNVSCQLDTDCLGSCKNGKCVGQRTGLDPITGLPTCVLDTCYPNGTWVGQLVPPYAFGHCVCNPDAVSTDYGCVKKPAPQPPNTCDDSCNHNGMCLKDNICQCNTGWKGKTCGEYYCSFDCPNGGNCIGPNTCQCPAGKNFDTLLQQCVTAKACTPLPSVDSDTGTIANFCSFSNSSQTACLCGDAVPDQVEALCKQSKCSMNRDSPYPVHCTGDATWDGYELQHCVKSVDCSQVMCDDENLCNEDVTNVTGPISQIPVTITGGVGTSCANPGISTVQTLCENSSPLQNPAVLIRVTNTDKYACENLTQRPTIQIDLSTLKSITGDVISGIMCVQMTQTQHTQDMPLSGYFRLVNPTDCDDIENPCGALVEGFIPLTPVSSAFCPYNPSATTSGVSYNFSIFLSSLSPEVQAIMVEGKHMDLFLYAIPDWADTSEDSPTVLLYTLADAPLNIELAPQGNQPDISPALLPHFQPQLASTLAHNAAWVQDVMKSLNSPHLIAGTTVTSLPVTTPAPYDVAVQAGCMDTYCKTFTGGIGYKFVIMAWLPVPLPDAADMCAGVDRKLFPTVNYVLERTDTLGETEELVGPGRQPQSFDDNGTTALYYVDLRPTGTQVWTYALASYMATSVDDEDTTYDTSPCKSRKTMFSMKINPYTDEFCQTLSAPDPTEPMPPFTWKNKGTGMCEWQNLTAASDYYCSVLKTNNNVFSSENISLVNAAGTDCGTLEQSFPSLTADWTSATCDPGVNFTPEQVCITGERDQSRNAQCSTALNIEGGGQVLGETSFQQRMDALYQFYRDHHVGPPTAGIESIATTSGQSEVFNNSYFSCGLLTNPNWGVTDAECDKNDKACHAATLTGNQCLNQNDCKPWINVSQPNDKINFLFQQNRNCYPSAKFDTDNSVCCNSNGTYKVTRGNSDTAWGSCDCNGTFIGSTCGKDICLDEATNKPISCNNHGTCGKVGGVVKCSCDDGWFNVNTKDKSILTPATPNLFTCNQNDCLSDHDGIKCGGSPTYMNPTLDSGFPTPTHGGGYSQGGVCNTESGLCECAHDYQCWDNDQHYPQYKGLCLQKTNCQSDTGAECSGEHSGDPRWCITNLPGEPHNLCSPNFNYPQNCADLPK